MKFSEVTLLPHVENKARRLPILSTKGASKLNDFFAVVIKNDLFQLTTSEYAALIGCSPQSVRNARKGVTFENAKLEHIQSYTHQVTFDQKARAKAMEAQGILQKDHLQTISGDMDSINEASGTDDVVSTPEPPTIEFSWDKDRNTYMAQYQRTDGNINIIQIVNQNQLSFLLSLGSGH